jgi:ABC-2 type transport system permease protein
MNDKEAVMAKRGSMASQLRIISAIAAKDLVDALKNRTILSIVIGVFFVVLAGRALSLVTKIRPTHTALVTGVEAAEFVESIGESETYQVVDVESMDAIHEVLATSATPYLGIVLPDDWQSTVAHQQDLELTGYVQHWVSRSELDEVRLGFEDYLNQTLGTPVSIDTTGNLVYPMLEFSGSPFMISIGLVVAVLLIGLILVPMLILEEKEQRTIDVLLISPASYANIVVGKAVAGMVYCLAAVCVLVLINANYIVQWDLLLVSILLGTLLAVLIGLFMGILFDQASTMNMTMGIIVLPLLVPIFLHQLNSEMLPGWLDAILPWIPSVTLDELFRMSFIQEVYPDRVVADLGLLVVGVVLMLILNSWRIRRLTA